MFQLGKSLNVIVHRKKKRMYNMLSYQLVPLGLPVANCEISVFRPATIETVLCGTTLSRGIETVFRAAVQHYELLKWLL